MPNTLLKDMETVSPQRLAHMKKEATSMVVVLKAQVRALECFTEMLSLVEKHHEAMGITGAKPERKKRRAWSRAQRAAYRRTMKAKKKEPHG